MQSLADILSLPDLDIFFEGIHAGIALVDRSGALIAWNSAFEICKSNEPHAGNLDEFFFHKDRQKVRDKLSSGIRENWVASFPFKGADSMVVCHCLLIPVTNERAIFFVNLMDLEDSVQGLVDTLSRRVKLFQIESDFTKKLAHDKQVELDAVVAQAREVAQTDPLTFLFNRRAIIREFQDEVMRAERYNSVLSVSILDVDHFKNINDTYGHTTGDAVLRQVAQRLRDGVRHPDIVGRYGGEEFIIVLPSSTITAAAEQAARLCKNMSETVIKVREHVIQVTLSIGVAQLRNGEDTWDLLLNRADNAMYEAKKQGRSRWVAAE